MKILGFLNWDSSSQGKFDLLHLELDFVVVKKVVIDIEMKSLMCAMHPRSEVENGGAWGPLSAASGGAWRRVRHFPGSWWSFWGMFDVRGRPFEPLRIIPDFEEYFGHLQA